MLQLEGQKSKADDFFQLPTELFNTTNKNLKSLDDNLVTLQNTDKGFDGSELPQNKSEALKLKSQSEKNSDETKMKSETPSLAGLFVDEVFEG